MPAWYVENHPSKLVDASICIAVTSRPQPVKRQRFLRAKSQFVFKGRLENAFFGVWTGAIWRDMELV